jgi:hypothetical protein
MDNSDHFLRTTRTTFLGQLGPIFSVKSDHFLCQLRPLCKDNSEHVLKTIRTNFWRQIGPHFLTTYNTLHNTCTLFCLLGFECVYCWILLSWFLCWSFFPLSQYFDVFRVNNKGIIKLKKNNMWFFFYIHVVIFGNLTKK